MGNAPTSRIRVPVGSLIAIAPPAGGVGDVLRPLLAATGLPAARVVDRDDLRMKFGNRCHALGCRAVPSSCRHHESEIDALVEAHATTFLAAGQRWLYSSHDLSESTLREQVHRAHRAGLAAVALRRATPSGAVLPLQACQEVNRVASRRIPDADLHAAWQQYAAWTTERLYGLGFDLVVDWDEDTHVELLPESFDARGIDTRQMVVVGDLHGCARTFFERLLPAIGTDAALSNPDVVVVSVGDIHDKGADPQGSVDLIRWWLWALRSGRALMVDSNHNRKLVRHLAGQNVRVSPGLADTLAAIEAQPDAQELKEQIVASFSRLPSHLWFDDLVVVHAGITEDKLGLDTGRARSFMLYVRDVVTPWQWTGSQTLVHGHEPVPVAERRQERIDPARPGHVPGPVVNVDTGAYTGGSMTAYVHATGTTIAVDTFSQETRAGHTDEVDDLEQAVTLCA